MIKGTVACRKVRAVWWSWWPVLLGPTVSVGFYLVVPEDYVRGSGRSIFEITAIILTGTAVMVGLFRLGVQRLEYHVILTLLACTVLLREIHWNWTDLFVYVAVFTLACWGWLRRRSLDIFLDVNPSARVWLIASGCTYVLSQAMARRAFRGFLPEENRFYNDLEELLECMAHVMLIVTILVGSWQQARKKAVI